MTTQYFKDLLHDMNHADAARRGTGRTTDMIDQASDGDFMIVPSLACAGYARDHAKKIGKKIIFLVAHSEMGVHRELQKTRGCRGKIWIDHSVLDAITRDKIAQFEKMVKIIHIQNQPFAEKST